MELTAAVGLLVGTITPSELRGVGIARALSFPLPILAGTPCNSDGNTFKSGLFAGMLLQGYVATYALADNPISQGVANGMCPHHCSRQECIPGMVQLPQTPQ